MLRTTSIPALFVSLSLLGGCPSTRSEPVPVEEGSGEAGAEGSAEAIVVEPSACRVALEALGAAPDADAIEAAEATCAGMIRHDDCRAAATGAVGDPIEGLEACREGYCAQAGIEARACEAGPLDANREFAAAQLASLVEAAEFYELAARQGHPEPAVLASRLAAWIDEVGALASGTGELGAMADARAALAEEDSCRTAWQVVRRSPEPPQAYDIALRRCLSLHCESADVPPEVCGTEEAPLDISAIGPRELIESGFTILGAEHGEEPIALASFRIRLALGVIGTEDMSFAGSPTLRPVPSTADANVTIDIPVLSVGAGAVSLNGERILALEAGQVRPADRMMADGLVLRDVIEPLREAMGPGDRVVLVSGRGIPAETLTAVIVSAMQAGTTVFELAVSATTWPELWLDATSVNVRAIAVSAPGAAQLTDGLLAIWITPEGFSFGHTSAHEALAAFNAPMDGCTEDTPICVASAGEVSAYRELYARVMAIHDAAEIGAGSGHVGVLVEAGVGYEQIVRTLDVVRYRLEDGAAETDEAFVRANYLLTSSGERQPLFPNVVWMVGR